MNITDHERKAIERVQDANCHLRGIRWLSLSIGALLCALYWKSPVQLAQWIYNDSTQSSSYPDVKYITMFLLGLYIFVSTLTRWRGDWRDKLILKLATECGVLKDSGK